MNDYTYIYRKSAPWGIWIKIFCTAHKRSEFKGNVIEISSCLYIAFPKDWLEEGVINQEEVASFKNGLELVVIELCKRVEEPLVIEVLKLEYNPTDFQIEGLGYAIAKWVDSAYGLQIELPAVEFDSHNNRYVFPYSI